MATTEKRNVAPLFFQGIERCGRNVERIVDDAHHRDLFTRAKLLFSGRNKELSLTLADRDKAIASPGHPSIIRNRGRRRRTMYGAQNRDWKVAGGVVIGMIVDKIDAQFERMSIRKAAGIDEMAA